MARPTPGRSRPPSVPRTLVVCCADWAAYAVAPHAFGPPAAGRVPVAVLEQHRVVATSPTAQAAGVRAGQRRREAEAHCPELSFVVRDEGAEVRAFEPVARALESFGVPVTVRSPGWAALPTRGPARRLGGEAGLRSAVLERIASLGPSWQLGIADGAFAASLAAEAGTIVPPGASAAFLAPFAIERVGDPELADLLRRLGIVRLGDLARLPEGVVLARFGVAGASAQCRAKGLEATAGPPRPVAVELGVGRVLDPPAERVEAVVLVARALAEELAVVLARRGLACTLLAVEAETATGELARRCWSDEGGWTPGLIAERLRWQLEAWLALGGAGGGGGIAAVRLVPLEAVPASGRQLSLWGRSVERVEAEARAARVVARVQGMLGEESVLRPIRRGGRGPGEQILLVPVGDPTPRLPGAPEAPWPGRLPAPAPAAVPDPPLPARLCDQSGALVVVDGRGRPSAPPASVQVAGGAIEAVRAVAGPFPVDERFWDRRRRRRRARFQVLTETGEGYLLLVERGEYRLEGRYD
ncbi:MAG: DNA polymerase Y family protein [Actinomycetota bacterium]|nr:DNA polymerase Y family protein [Actinomycetota bacterium]